MNPNTLDSGMRSADSERPRRPLPYGRGAVGPRRRWLCLAIGVACVFRLVPSTASRGQEPSAQTRSHRILHEFDFDERDDGNFENTPMYWRPLELSGFPEYAVRESGFDTDVGHDAPPSFLLNGYGKSVAYLYSGPDTRVRPDTSHIVSGWIRPGHLRHGRALLSAVYLDHRRRPLADTLVNSEIVGGTPCGDGARSAPSGAGTQPAPRGTGSPPVDCDWTQVRTHLPPAPPDAVSIGLIAWVLQEEQWDTSPRVHRYIPKHDAEGVAWFDDLAVHALPRASLETGSPGHVVDDEGGAYLDVHLVDTDDVTLAGRLSVLDRSGEAVVSASVPVVIGEASQGQRVSVAHLAPGVYLAKLDVYSGADLIVTRHLRFVRAAPLRRGPDAVVRSLGVAVDPDTRAPHDAELDLLRNLKLRSVKLPIWGGGRLRSGLADAKETDAYLRELVRAGFSLTAVIAELPASLNIDNRPLVDVFADDPGAYRPHLADILAPHAAYFRWWQLGGDGDDEVAEHPRLAPALERFRAEMRPFVNAPRLMAPDSSRFDRRTGPLPAEGMSLTLHPELQPSAFADQIEAQRTDAPPSFDVFAVPLPEERYDAHRWAADWARRLIEARHAGPQVVYAPQPWSVRRGGDGVIAEPKAEYLTLRTIADVLGDANPGGVFSRGPGIEALVFHSELDATLAIWSPSAPPARETGVSARSGPGVSARSGPGVSARHPEEHVYALQLGAATEWIDLTGVSHTIEKDDTGRHLLPLTSTPIFIPGIERWLLDFQMAVRLEPARVDFNHTASEHGLMLANRSGTPISGEVRLIAPDGWTLTPEYFNVSLAADRAQRYPVQVVFPHSEPAGEKIILARMTISPGGHYMEIPLKLELGPTDLDVWAVPAIEGDDLVLRHMVTNRSEEVLQLRGSASAPGRSRQYKPFTNLRPGDTGAAEYRISGGANLSGRFVRLMLREVGDGSRMHNLEVRVP